MKVLSINSGGIPNFVFLAIHTKTSPSVEKTTSLYRAKTVLIQNLLVFIAVLPALLPALLPVTDYAPLTR